MFKLLFFVKTLLIIAYRRNAIAVHLNALAINATPSLSLPLLFCTFQLNAFAMLFRAPPSHCDSIQILAIPLQYNSFPFIAIADQIDSALTHALANHRASFHRHAFAFLFRAPQSLCPASLCSALPLQFASWHCASLPLLFNSEHCISLPSHYISMLFAALAMLYISSPCLRCSTQVTSFPRNTVASLRVLHSAIA